MKIIERNAPKTMKFAALAGAMVLVGCSGNTYGTGVSQNSQLASDIGGMLALGTSRKTARIDYAARPKLVKAPADAPLPAPAQTLSDDSAYFPMTPEEKRARLRSEADQADEILARGGTLSPELQAARTAAITRKSSSATRVGEFMTDAEIKAQREQYVAQHGKPVSPDSVTLKTRKYLTQPPVEYGQPAETAPIGDVGEKEVDIKKLTAKKEKSFLKKIFGG